MKKFFSAILIICLMIVMPVMVSCGKKATENLYSLAVTYVDMTDGENGNFVIKKIEKEDFFHKEGYYYSVFYDTGFAIYFSSSVDISKKFKEAADAEFVVYFPAMYQELEIQVNNEEPTTLSKRLPSENEEFEYVEFSFTISQNTEVVITVKP